MTSSRTFLFPFFIAIASVGVVRAQTPAGSVKREMIDVGDHKLQMVRGGAGKVTVVFEAGAGGRLNGWLPLAAKNNDLAATVCYSRAGAGGPESSTYVRTPVAVATELHEMLKRAGVPAPYVLVGHSMGGLYVRAFATKYPTEVAGLVLVDPSHERQRIVTRQLFSVSAEQLARAESEAPKYTGTTRLEWDGAQAVFASGKLDIEGSLPDVPMSILTSIQATADSGEGSISEHMKKAVMAAKRAMHAEIIAPVSQTQHVVTDRVGHNMHREAPDMVVAAVRWVVAAVNAPAPKEGTSLGR